MEKIYCLCFFAALWMLATPHRLAAQTDVMADSLPQPAEAGRYFDPETMPIGVIQSDGSFLLTVSEAILTRSLKTFMPEVGIVQKVVKQKIRGQEHIVFECRNAADPDRSLFVAILLRSDEMGHVFADRQYNTCAGSPCGDCKFTSSGCICAEQAPADDPTRIGSCNHTVSTRLALAKVRIALD